jgi:hypothetical protein
MNKIILFGKLEGKGHVGDLNVDGRKILKWVLIGYENVD